MLEIIFMPPPTQKKKNTHPNVPAGIEPPACFLEGSLKDRPFLFIYLNSWKLWSQTPSFNKDRSQNKFFSKNSLEKQAAMNISEDIFQLQAHNPAFKNARASDRTQSAFGNMQIWGFNQHPELFLCLWNQTNNRTSALLVTKERLNKCYTLFTEALFKVRGQLFACSVNVGILI